jgi:hypothetical protein
MGKVHDRISDRNKRRKLQFGQATLLGVTFRKRDVGGSLTGAQWSFDIPEHMKPVGRGYTSGFYHHKWGAVEAALRVLGLTA